MAENDVEPHTACKVPFALVQPTKQRKKNWKNISNEKMENDPS